MLSFALPQSYTRTPLRTSVGDPHARRRHRIFCCCHDRLHPIINRSQQEELEKAETDARNRRQRLEATKITSDVNAERVGQLRGLRVKVPGTGTGEDLEGAKEVSERRREVLRGELGTTSMNLFIFSGGWIYVGWFVLVCVTD